MCAEYVKLSFGPQRAFYLVKESAVYDARESRSGRRPRLQLAEESHVTHSGVHSGPEIVQEGNPTLPLPSESPPSSPTLAGCLDPATARPSLSRVPVKGAGFKLKEMGEDGRGSLEPADYKSNTMSFSNSRPNTQSTQNSIHDYE